MINEKIGEIFDFISETNLTEQDFYNNIGEFPVYSGQTENDGIVARIGSYNQQKPCIIFTTYGNKAGKLNYRDGKFTIGRNAMGMRPKQKYEEDINLKWFCYKFQNLFYRTRIGESEGQRSLNKLLINNIKINIPDVNVQNKELLYYEKAAKLYKKIIKLKKDLNELLQSNQRMEEIKYKDKIKNIFKIVGGNNGLTEEFVYYNQPVSKEEKIIILSGATTNNNLLGFIDINSKPSNKDLKVFKAPFVQIIRKGLAGRMVYIKDGQCTANDDIYILQIRETWVEKVNLRWFCYQYQELFYNLTTSKSDNATFNKEYAENQDVSIPDIKIQNMIAEKLLNTDELFGKLEKLIDQIEKLIEYEIII